MKKSSIVTDRTGNDFTLGEVTKRSGYSEKEQE